MIATVKIAPFERWCDYAKESAGEERPELRCGCLVRIRIDYVRQAADCGGKVWNIEETSHAELFPHMPRHSGYGICEHMLEMD